MGDSRNPRIEHSSSTGADPLRELGIFRTADALRVGISQPTLSRLARCGVVKRLEHGLYMHGEATIDPAIIDFATALARFGPTSLIGGLTALFYYHLSDQAPDRIWVMIRPDNKSTHTGYHFIRTKHDPKVGVVEHPLYRIATVERAVIESFRYATKIGYQTALTAGREALRSGQVTAKSLHETAEELGLWRVMLKSWEALTTR